MKKVLMLMVCLGLILLGGCQENEDDVLEDLSVIDVVEADLITSPGKVEGNISFYYLDKKATPYLDFNEFLSKFPKLWGDYMKVDRQETKVVVTYKYQSGSNVYDEVIEVDFEKNLILFSKLSFSLGMELERTLPIELVLEDYNIHLFDDGEKKLIPISLCNLFLSEVSYGVLLTNQAQMYWTSHYNPNFNEMYKQFQADTESMGPDLDERLMAESFEYLTLLMDNVYGLKSYQGVESFRPLIDEVKVNDDLNFYEKLQQFVIDLNDGHSMVMGFSNNGIEMDNERFVKMKEENEYLQKAFDAYERNSCAIKADEAIQVFREDVIYMDYRSFTTNDESKYKQVLEEVENKIIILDIRCNMGGYIDSSTQDLLDYFSNEPISYFMANIQGGLYQVTTDARVSKNRYVLLTSPYSFSSANLFANVFKENKLGTIVGERTGGRSAVVGEYALPDGTVLTLSMDKIMVNSKGEIIEAGVEPDIPLFFTPDINLKEVLLEIIDEQVLN